jgi:hypothetical protein
VILEKTCLPTIIISDMARGLIVKPFIYNEKPCEMERARNLKAGRFDWDACKADRDAGRP